MTEPVESRKPIAVVGLGNLMMSDEGIGVRLVQELAKSGAEFPSVEFVDAGSSLMSVLHAVAFREKAFVIDCALMGERPGALLCFDPCAAASKKALAGLSLHEGDLANIFELSRKLGEAPERVTVIGIEPDRVAPGEKLSPALESKFEFYLNAVKSELKEACGYLG